MSQAGIPVLMYHALEDAQHPAGAKDQGEQLYILSTDKFREQMQYLHANGFKTYLLKELINLNDWPQKAVVLTFDDGHESNYTLALPILQEFGFKAEFFITTGWIGTKHFLKPEQIIGLCETGMGIGSHSVTHPYFDDLSDEEIIKELNDSKHSLQKILNQKITSFSVPGGRFKNSTMINIAKNANYKTIYSSCPSVFTKSTSCFKIPRIAIGANTNTDRFVKIVTMPLALQIKIKSLTLNFAKTLLGNSTYETIRLKLLQIPHKQNKTKILHLISTKAFLGAERVITELCNGANNETLELTVGIIENQCNITKIFKESIQNKNVRIITFLCNKQFDISCLNEIRKVIKNDQITTIHSHGYKSDFYAFVARTLSPIHKITLYATNHLWKDTTKKEKLYKYSDAVVLRFFNKIIAVSTKIKESMINVGINKNKIIVIDNGINVKNKDFTFPRIEARKLLKLNDSDFIIGCVGSLTSEKGHKNLLLSFQYLEPNNRDQAKIIIIGDGSELEALKTIIITQGLEKKIIMVGRRDDARKLYSAFDIFVLPSYNEGLPMVMLEAMAASIPVIASNVGAIPNVITHNRNGFLTQPGDACDIAQKIDMLRHDNKLRILFATRGQQTIEKYYSSKKMVQSYENIYASSDKSVGDFRNGQVAKRMI